MVVVKLMGGLGNQMFQYAAGKSLSLRLKTSLKLDLAWYQKQSLSTTPRKYELSIFDLPDNQANRLERWFIASLGTRFTDKNLSFQPAFNHLSGQIYLDGYWPSEKYFLTHAQLIRSLYKFPKHVSPQTNKYHQQILTTHAIAVHIRRGDYANSAKTRAFHGLLSLKYYHQAITLMQTRLPKPTFYFFSDDLPWVKKTFQPIPHVVWVDTKVAPDWEQLYLMTQCQHHIIANSTYSWWGAWLNPSESKIVVAPQRWFTNPSMKTKDITPAKWIKL